MKSFFTQIICLSGSKCLLLLIPGLLFTMCGDDNSVQNIAPSISDQSFNVSEAVSDSEVIGTVIASDPDEDDLTFTIITNDTDLFSISTDGQLSLASGKSLDFETSTLHTITVEVSDGPNHASALVTINVIDIDENTAPTIDDQSFNVAEDIGDGEVIGTVAASDAEGDDLTFNIASEGEGKSGSLFEINNAGEISLDQGQSLDYEAQSTHIIAVKVTDGELSATANITIIVTDVDENSAPVIETQNFSASENISDTEPIGTVSAFDPDGDNLTFSLEIPDAFGGLFEITDGGVLSLASGKSLDYETSQSYQFGVIVTDGQALSTGTIVVNVTDEVEETITVSTFAGNGSPGDVDGTATGAQFDEPYSVAIDGSGNVYVSDFDNHKIRKITPAGVVTTFAGSGVAGNKDANGTSAQFNMPAGIVYDASSGYLYVADLGNHSIRRIAPGAIGAGVTTLAGSGSAGFADGTGAAAQFNGPSGLDVDDSGNIYVADYNNHRIRKVTSGGVVSTLAGDGVAGVNNGDLDNARFNKPADVAVNSSGWLYVADNSNHMIRRIVPSTNQISTIAGTGGAGFLDSAIGTQAKFSGPVALDIDSQGNIFVSDINNSRIRKITSGHIVSTVVGSAGSGFVDGDHATAKIKNPIGLEIDPGTGYIYITEQSNHAVRKIVIQE